MSRLRFRRAKGRDKDFEWFLRQLDERLGSLQELRGGVALGHSHVIREHGEEFSCELSDEGIAEALEFVGSNPEPIWRRFRGMLRAEQSRRQNRHLKHSNLLVTLTLIFAALGAIAGVVAVFK